jgi:hypothetical protein
VAPDVEAKAQIASLLERYRKANEALDFEAVRDAHPKVHENVRSVFRDLASLKYQMGEAKFLELQVGRGQAILEVPTKQIYEPRSGIKRPPSETIAKITLTKVNAQNRWVIDTIMHRRPE